MMRLRNRVIPQAGTGAVCDGESRPGPSGSGCPSYSGGATSRTKLPNLKLLQNGYAGYRIHYNDRQIQTQTINHLLYMDDIKLYAATESELYKLTELTEQFTIDIKMNFGSQQINYKYTKYKLRQTFQHRLNAIMKSKLYSRNTVKAINTFAIPILTYSFGVINWNKTDLINIQRNINTTMTKTTHYNRPDITLVDKINKTAFLIDIAVPNTHNLQTTIAEKLTKYIDLKDEITRLWNLQKVTIVPIVLSTTGIIPKQLHKSLDTLQLPPNLTYLMQKAVILNTCRIVRKFLQTDEERTTLHTPQTHPNSHTCDYSDLWLDDLNRLCVQEKCSKSGEPRAEGREPRAKGREPRASGHDQSAKVLLNENHPSTYTMEFR
ncbi:uncharacterized protein LOC121729112 [Aricia agestis]|uniref:uncharacterized protein LOC121729112 n=1 Tax=Aricia agestis TaxID=91739 RepID=UPI001C209F70|nr:uncharacterized protein LOC121729112 [Aricia agestis]